MGGIKSNKICICILLMYNCPINDLYTRLFLTLLVKSINIAKYKLHVNN